MFLEIRWTSGVRSPSPGSGKQCERHAAAEYFAAPVQHEQDNPFATRLRLFERFEVS